MKKILFATAILFLLTALPLRALDVGDKAPEIAAEAWIAGEPVDPTVVDGETFYVVEVWSVTCPPCVRTIPILNEIQKRYADKGLKVVSFTADAKEEAEAFIEQHPMEYSSFIDKDGVSIINYMAADNRNTIPHAFLFDKKGTLVWIGNPLDNLEQRVKQVLSGELNSEKAIALRDANQEIQDSLQAQDITRLLNAFKTMEELEPDNSRHYQMHYKILTEFGAGDENDVANLLAAWYKGTYDQPEGMAVLSMVAMEQGPYGARNPALSLAAAKRSFAIESEVRAQAGMNLADIYRSLGRIDLALKTLDEVSPLIEDEDEREVLKSVQEFYRQVQETGKNPDAEFTID